jgi:single-strand DNA-binding protein
MPRASTTSRVQDKLDEAEGVKKLPGTVSKVGTLGADPELQFSKAGNAFCRARIAVRVPGPNNDWENATTDWYDVTTFKTLAQNVAESLRKGDRVVVTGRAELRHWKTDEGEDRTNKVIVASGMGPDLRFATAEVTRMDGGTVDESESEVDF